MNEAMQQEILKRLDGIGDKLGKAGLYSWDLLVRKVYWIDGWLSLALGVVGLLVLVWAVRRLPAHIKVIHDAPYDNIPLGSMLSTFGWTAAGLLGTIFAIANLTTAPARILLPDYYALQTILELLKK